MMARQADGQMSIKEDAEGDIDAAAYAEEYADADADVDDAAADDAAADDTSDAEEKMRRY